ncbi:hypothetical protein TNCV_3600981 [Trichonephila clavipes]|nr:hypothetical protein TNCV_3600981 [Trichonephila clavipes]
MGVSGVSENIRAPLQSQEAPKLRGSGVRSVSSHEESFCCDNGEEYNSNNDSSTEIDSDLEGKDQDTVKIKKLFERKNN